MPSKTKPSPSEYPKINFLTTMKERGTGKYVDTYASVRHPDDLPEIYSALAGLYPGKDIEFSTAPYSASQ